MKNTIRLELSLAQRLTQVHLATPFCGFCRAEKAAVDELKAVLADPARVGEKTARLALSPSLMAQWGACSGRTVTGRLPSQPELQDLPSGQAGGMEPEHQSFNPQLGTYIATAGAKTWVETDFSKIEIGAATLWDEVGVFVRGDSETRTASITGGLIDQQTVTSFTLMSFCDLDEARGHYLLPPGRPLPKLGEQFLLECTERHTQADGKVSLKLNWVEPIAPYPHSLEGDMACAAADYPDLAIKYGDLFEINGIAAMVSGYNRGSRRFSVTMDVFPADLNALKPDGCDNLGLGKVASAVNGRDYRRDDDGIWLRRGFLTDILQRTGKTLGRAGRVPLLHLPGAAQELRDKLDQAQATVQEMGELIDDLNQKLSAVSSADTCVVDRGALHQLLDALQGPGHLIRELQVTRGLPDGSNPIDTLVRQVK